MAGTRMTTAAMSAVPVAVVRRAGRANAAGLLVTVALHAGAVWVVLFAHGGGSQVVESPRDFVITEMVKLGKPREKFWLPRIVTPPKAQAPAPVLKIAEDPNAAPAPTEAPRPEDPEISKETKRALERARLLAAAAAQEELDEGQATGSAEGTANEAKEGDAYASAVVAAIRKNWVVPALIDDQELKSLKAQVRLKISEDGTLSDVKLHKSSGNNLYDDACVQAAQATTKVGPPPASVAAQFAKGVALGCDPRE